jgi:hypothetical protein
MAAFTIGRFNLIRLMSRLDIRNLDLIPDGADRRGADPDFLSDRAVRAFRVPRQISAVIRL